MEDNKNFSAEIIELNEFNNTTKKLHEPKNLHQSFKTLERYPVNKLIALYTYLSDLAMKHPLGSDHNIEDETDSVPIKINNQLKVIEKIFNMVAEAPSTIVGTEYRFINGYGYRSEECKGRLYGDRNTMTQLSRQCRYYLFKGLYIDFDLKNAHPTILFSYATNNHLPAQCLKHYVDNREDFLQNVMKDSGLTRSDAKTAVLRSLNLVTDNHLPEVLKPFHKDILRIRNHLYK